MQRCKCISNYKVLRELTRAFSFQSLKFGKVAWVAESKGQGVILEHLRFADAPVCRASVALPSAGVSGAAAIVVVRGRNECGSSLQTSLICA